MAEDRWQMTDGRFQMADDRWQIPDGRMSDYRMTDYRMAEVLVSLIFKVQHQLSPYSRLSSVGFLNLES